MQSSWIAEIFKSELLHLHLEKLPSGPVGAIRGEGSGGFGSRVNAAISAVLSKLGDISSLKRRAKKGTTGFSLLSNGFGKSFVEHCGVSLLSTGRRHLSSAASGTVKASSCYQPAPLAVKKISLVGFERKRQMVYLINFQVFFFPFP